MSRKSSRRKHSVHWFRKGLRLSDNPALLRAIRRCETFRCIFILDPWFAGSSNVGTNKWRFLLECLEDLDASLRKLNSRLFVVRGQPADVLPTLFKEWGTSYFTFEEDPEPYGRVRDQNIVAMCKEMGITVTHEHSHTLYNLDKIIERNSGKAPLTFKQFQAIIEGMEPPPKPVPTLTLQMLGQAVSPIQEDHDEKYGVPSLEELGFDVDNLRTSVWPGGETEALSRLERHLERKAWVASFGRPKMTPQSLLASQTGLSPYLRFGCLSTRLFYHAHTDLYRKIKKCDPPLSLHGQLLWREFFYCAATKNPNFDRMVGNPICVQIPWDRNDEALSKWAGASTGFPWIDAIMTQLREEGWIHHLARHAVACFLTRGDLWVSWEEGMKVFDELLLDADWSVNAGTWLWLSCSSFFQQFFHCYCPVKFGRKADANGDFIRRYIPALKNFPTRYIHEPWTAPEAVQKSAKCIIGVDYPKPMCNHAFVSKMNLERMKQVYQQLAFYRQTGQSGPKIPHELLAQLPKLPKIRSPTGSGSAAAECVVAPGEAGSCGVMGPPNPPDARRKYSGGAADAKQLSCGGNVLIPGVGTRVGHLAAGAEDDVVQRCFMDVKQHGGVAVHGGNVVTLSDSTNTAAGKSAPMMPGSGLQFGQYNANLYSGLSSSGPSGHLAQSPHQHNHPVQSHHLSQQPQEHHVGGGGPGGGGSSSPVVTNARGIITNRSAMSTSPIGVVSLSNATHAQASHRLYTTNASPSGGINVKSMHPLMSGSMIHYPHYEGPTTTHQNIEADRDAAAGGRLPGSNRGPVATLVSTVAGGTVPVMVTELGEGRSPVTMASVNMEYNPTGTVGGRAVPSHQLYEQGGHMFIHHQMNIEDHQAHNRVAAMQGNLPILTGDIMLPISESLLQSSQTDTSNISNVSVMSQSSMSSMEMSTSQSRSMMSPGQTTRVMMPSVSQANFDNSSIEGYFQHGHPHN